MRRSERALGTRVDEETHGLVADAVIALSGPPLRLTKKRLVTDALRFYVAQLAREHNGGKPFAIQADRRLTQGSSEDAVGKRKTGGVDPQPRARARARAKRKGNAPARARRRGKGRRTG